jgi:hypothetical protein
MALDDLEKKRWVRDIEEFLARRRPPPHIRPELDIGYRITNCIESQARQTCGVSDDERERLNDGSHAANSVSRL